MTAPLISATALIPAPGDAIYGVIADYTDGHDRIIPRPPFVGLAVEEGGFGAGPRVDVRMKVLGRVHRFRAQVTEPEPGRLLVETNETGWVTTFAVDPVDDRSARVTISSLLTGRGRLRTALETRLSARLLRRTYARELARLEEVAATRFTALPAA